MKIKKLLSKIFIVLVTFSCSQVTLYAKRSSSKSGSRSGIKFTMPAKNNTKSSIVIQKNKNNQLKQNKQDNNSIGYTPFGWYNPPFIINHTSSPGYTNSSIVPTAFITVTPKATIWETLFTDRNLAIASFSTSVMSSAIIICASIYAYNQAEVTIEFDQANEAIEDTNEAFNIVSPLA